VSENAYDRIFPRIDDGRTTITADDDHLSSPLSTPAAGHFDATMKLDGRHGGVFGAAAGLGDNGDRPPTAAAATAGQADVRAGPTPSPPRHRRDRDHDTGARAAAGVPKTSAVSGSSLFTIDSILAPSKSSPSSLSPSSSLDAAAAAAGRNTVVTATTAAAAAAGFFKQPISFGHLAAAAAASGYAHSTAANFLGMFTRARARFVDFTPPRHINPIVFCSPAAPLRLSTVGSIIRSSY